MVEMISYEECKKRYPLIREDVHLSIKNYVERKIRPGHFLEAVLTDSLSEAIFRADGQNLKALEQIVRFVYWEIPSIAWGDKKRFEIWLNGDD